MAKGSHKEPEILRPAQGGPPRVIGGAYLGRARARRLYPNLPDICEDCGEEKRIERHHKDGDTENNAPENIAFVCRRCHMEADGRLAITRAGLWPRSPLLTHCPRDHAYDEANTYWYGNARYCRACNRESHRRKAHGERQS